MKSSVTLSRRGGIHFRYTLTYFYGDTVARLEFDIGRTNTSPLEPTRRICIADASHIEELQAKCDKWNAENAETFRKRLMAFRNGEYFE